jgi:hypothetical protein
MVTWMTCIWIRNFNPMTGNKACATASKGLEKIAMILKKISYKLTCTTMT